MSDQTATAPPPTGTASEDANPAGQEQRLALLEFAFNSAREAAFLHDDRGRFELVNDEACRALGYTRSELLAMGVGDVDPDYPDARGREATATVRREGSLTFESAHRRKDGRLVPVEVTATRFEHNGAAHTLALARDISERKAAEATIRRLHADLEATLRAIPDLLFEFDRDGTYLKVHAPRPELLAVPAEQLIGRTLADTMPPEVLAVGMAVIREAEERGISRGRVYSLDLPEGRRSFEVVCAKKADLDGTGPHFVSLIRDITEYLAVTEALRGREEELRESRERYRIVFDNVREHLFLLEVTEDGRFRNLEVNPALAAAVGMPREALVGKTQEQVVGPEVAESVNREYRRVAETGVILEGRKELDLPGGPRVYESTLIPVRDDTGRVNRIVGLSRDVTERELADRARRVTEANFRTLLEQASEAIFVADTSMRYTDVNIAACELLGYTREELLALRIQDVTPPDANPGQPDRLQRLAAGEVIVSERMLRRKDGTLVPAELSVRRLPDGRLQAMGRDITERRRSQQEQARLAAAVEQAAEAIVITDPSSVIVYVNPAFERVSGYSRAEVIGQTPRLIQSGQHDAAFYRSMWDTLLAGQTWHGTLVNRHKDGTLYEEDASIRATYDETGQLASYVAVKRDVTRERALESEVRQMQKMEVVGQLAGGIAHDFNNLITAMRGYAEMAHDSLPPQAPEREDLREAMVAADRASDLTRRLLAFARRLPLAPTVVSPSDVVARLVPMLRRLLGEHIELDCDPYGSGLVLADRSQLEQVIVNLAVNARDAMPEGGRLAIATSDVELERAPEGCPGLAVGRYVELRVTDTGIGMTDETRSHVFEPFYTTKALGEGTGLGLATVYGIVTASAGGIALESEIGVGTTCVIYLPRVQSDLRPPQADDIGTVMSGTETILLVEDEDAVRGFARRVLEGWGYRVVEAVNGAEGEVLARELGDRVDLLVSDVVMPQLSGVALLRRLREIRPGLRAVLMSGFTDADPTSLSPDASVVFLPKPFSSAALGRAVRTALGADASST